MGIQRGLGYFGERIGGLLTKTLIKRTLRIQLLLFMGIETMRRQGVHLVLIQDRAPGMQPRIRRKLQKVEGLE
jgi:hypothetical protein